MKFNAWSLERIETGHKRLTSRKKMYPLDPYVKAIVGPLPWYFIREYLYLEEGAVSSDELQRVINKIFRRHVTDNEEFYVHIIDRDAVLKGGQ